MSFTRTIGDEHIVVISDILNELFTSTGPTACHSLDKLSFSLHQDIAGTELGPLKSRAIKLLDGSNSNGLKIMSDDTGLIETYMGYEFSVYVRASKTDAGAIYVDKEIEFKLELDCAKTVISGLSDDVIELTEKRVVTDIISNSGYKTVSMEDSSINILDPLTAWSNHPA